MTGTIAFATIFISLTLPTLKITSLSVVAKSIKLWASLPTFRLLLEIDVILVCAGVISNVLVAEISPPPVNPLPAVISTEVWLICSFATKFAKLS